MAQVRQGIAAYRATGAALFVPYLCTLLADVSAHLGHPEDGLQALAEAHTLVEQHEERWWEAEVCRLRGVLLLRQPGTPQAEAEAWLQRALDVARRQEAKSLELRAAMSLSRLWQQQGKRAEARELLAPIYGWFTEGFDTADLQEAKALLEEFSQYPLFPFPPFFTQNIFPRRTPAPLPPPLLLTGALIPHLRPDIIEGLRFPLVPDAQHSTRGKGLHGMHNRQHEVRIEGGIQRE